MYCLTCEAGRTNVGKGNSACHFYVSSIPLAIPLAFCVLYIFCSLVGFVGMVYYGGSFPSVDQILEILFAFLGVLYYRKLHVVFCTNGVEHKPIFGWA